MNSPRALLPVALTAAVLGGALAIGGVALFDVGGDTRTTTIVQQAPLSDATPASNTSALTPRDIYKRDAPGVVFIRSEIVQQSAPSVFDLQPQQQRGEATGSGFVVDGDGSILTNAHVIANAVKVTVQLADKKVVEAKILGRDVSSDLALIKVDPDGLDLQKLALGSSKSVQVGDPTIAIGNPFGLDRTLTTGVVSALQRKITAPNGFTINNVIQTDAAINPGNSGGPLLDAAGRVIGINSQIETGGGGNGNVGIGFAVPIDTVKQKLNALKTSGTVQYAYLGVSSATVDASFAGLLPVKTGALVQAVTAGSPAAKAGLKGGDITAQVGGTPVALGGDIITKVDGRTVKTADDLSAIVSRHKAGDTVSIEFVRDHRTRTVQVTLAKRPASLAADQQPAQVP